MSADLSELARSGPTSKWSHTEASMVNSKQIFFTKRFTHQELTDSCGISNKFHSKLELLNLTYCTFKATCLECSVPEERVG